MKRALITGSSTGFGRDLASALLERGWTVYASLRNSAGREALFAEDRKRFGERLRVLELDVAQAAQREAAARAIEAEGGLDCLVNNAAFGHFGPFELIPEDAWRRQFEVNFFGALFLTRRLLPALRTSRGRILNLSSILGLASFPLSSPYAASKFALEGWSEALYYELAPHGVQVGLVEPGGFRTKFSDNLLVTPAPADSPYAGQSAAYARWREKRAGGAGTPPEVVVRALVRLCEARRIPLRTVVGLDARALDGIGRWLPRNLATGLLSRVYARLMPK
ncbi:MAG: SDR family oxidoreductase [Elusimicrobia bacterium]|nr:SDR family oxidoreductase [Elusimicrobiota bacterium]